MSSTWIIIALILGFVIVFQIAKASEYVSILRGEEKTRKENNRLNGFMLLAFLVVGLFGVWWCHQALIDRVLPPPSSNHGVLVDRMLFWTILVTGIVFVLTQAALFFFAWKYQQDDSRKAFFYPHNNRLEVIWTAVPAIVLTVLVGLGIFYWFKITGEAPKDAMIVEVVGKQFNWEVRYPGKDGVLGKKYYKEINEVTNNPLGQLWEDPANHDDVYYTKDVHVVVNRPVKLIIGAKDVIHDVGLSHFRLKMDAVPGIPTTMWFTPLKTTKQMKAEYGDDFEYEISCDQMCGAGHWSMRGVVIVETQQEYDAWIAQQKPQYQVAMAAMNPAPAGGDSTGAKKDSAALVRN